jgi:hypothetical protein
MLLRIRPHLAEPLVQSSALRAVLAHVAPPEPPPSAAEAGDSATARADTLLKRHCTTAARCVPWLLEVLVAHGDNAAITEDALLILRRVSWAHGALRRQSGSGLWAGGEPPSPALVAAVAPALEAVVAHCARDRGGHRPALAAHGLVAVFNVLVTGMRVPEGLMPAVLVALAVYPSSPDVVDIVLGIAEALAKPPALRPSIVPHMPALLDALVSC